MKFRPLGDRILVERVESEEKSSGGIILPDTAKEKPQQGVVISVGKGKRNDAGKIVRMNVKKGNRVLFGKFAGSEITIDGKDYLILKENDVLGIVET